MSTSSNEERRQILVKFMNSSPFDRHWAVKDEETDAVIIDKDFAPKEIVSAFIQAPNGTYGGVYYKHPDISTWNHKQLIENGETVELW